MSKYWFFKKYKSFFVNENPPFIDVLSIVINLNHYLSLSTVPIVLDKVFFSLKGNDHLPMQYWYKMWQLKSS